MNEYHRTIIAALRDHGARNVTLVPGGRHPHVDFVFRDKSFNLAVHGNPPGHSDASLIKIKELKTMLGEPDIAEPREARRLEDMTPNGVAPYQAPPMMGGVAMYATPSGKLQLRIFPPQDVVEFLGSDRTVRVERMAKGTWLLSTDPAAKRHIYRDGKTWILYVGVAEELTRGFTTPFGITPTEYTKVDGKIMVRLLIDQIRPIESRKPKRVKIDDHPTTGAVGDAPGWKDRVENWKSNNPVQDTEPAAEVQGDAVVRIVGANPANHEPRTANGTRWVEPTMLDPRAVLGAISKIEAATPYRLTKLTDGSWVFRAPTIRLGEGC